MSIYDPGITVKWVKHPECPKCGDSLELKGLHVSDLPYIHADMRLECPMCGEIYLFGIPKRRDVGLALYILDSNPIESLAYMNSRGDKKCPFGHGNMFMTKIFGDWNFKREKVEYQWKCPECFLTRHELHDRKFEHIGDREPLTPDEQADLMEKLRKMGYID